MDKVKANNDDDVLTQQTKKLRPEESSEEVTGMTNQVKNIVYV